jgi:hypothetical protein
MADEEIKAEIVFTDNNKSYVQSTVEEISSEIEAQKHLPLPLIKVVDQRGSEVWLNANHIREVKVPSMSDEDWAN